MLQANPTSSAFPSAYAPPAPHGRPKRGTPDYAAAVRQQIARLAALHAASVAETASLATTMRSVLVVSPNAQVRALVRESLRETSWVRVLECTSADDARGQMMAEAPDLVLVDHSERDVLSLAAGRAVLIVDRVPRSADLPADLAGVLAHPLKPERVARQVAALLGEHP